jgi:hypothetical protein
MIFNKSTNGAEEAKALLGFIYKSNEFKNLVTYITIAERDIKRVIGPEVFKLAEDHYLSENYQADITEETVADPQLILLDELVRLIQFPVLLHAYRRYAPLNDLDHSESGRSITVTEDKKPAFEWMIERDNKSLLDLAHETTDVLIEFLDEQVPIPYVPTVEDPTGEPTANTIQDTWKSSTTYAAQKDLFINSAREFDAIFPINASRRLYLALVPFIREVEQRHIRPAIGATKYDAIRELIKDDELDKAENEELKEIHDLAKIPIALLTISIALKRLNVELLPDSVVQSFSTISERQTKSADKFDRVGVSMLLERDGKREIIPLQIYITSLLPVIETPDEPFDITSPFYMP